MIDFDKAVCGRTVVSLELPYPDSSDDSNKEGTNKI